MRLNLPVMDVVQDCRTILIAGAGGGFDVFAGLPLYFTLRAAGKTVHLANYSFVDFELVQYAADLDVLLPGLLAATRGRVRVPLPYYPEGYLTQWFAERGEDIPVWMFAKTGVLPLTQAYQRLIEHLGGVDALLLVDGGVDSLMRGDEQGAGTLLEDTISLLAADALDVRVRLLATIGFGTEVEEAVSHHNALMNIAALTKAGAFYGCCALTPQMPAFQQYEAACRYVWEQPGHQKSHISTRIIPAVNGESGDFHLYPDDRRVRIYVSPLMSLYWFFDAAGVLRRSLIAAALRDSITFHDALSACVRAMNAISTPRPRGSIPY